MMPSCSTSHLNDLRDFKNDSNAKNLIFQKFLIFSFFCHFFAFEWRSKSSFLPPLEPIEIKILPDGIFFEASYPRKWNKIEIWTDEPPSNFDFKFPDTLVKGFFLLFLGAETSCQFPAGDRRTSAGRPADVRPTSGRSRTAKFWTHSSGNKRKKETLR